MSLLKQELNYRLSQVESYLSGLLGAINTWTGKQTFDGGAAIKGSSSAVAAGYVGEPKRVVQSTDVTTAGLDSTYSDLTGTAVSLTPGTWLLICNFGAYVPAWSGGTAIMVIGALYRTGTVLVQSSFIGGAVTAAQSATFVSSSFSVVVNISSSTDYYLRGAFTRYAGSETVASGAVFKQDKNWIDAIRIG